MSLLRQIWLVIITTTAILFLFCLFVGILITIELLSTDQSQKNRELAKIKALQISNLKLDQINFENQIINTLNTNEALYVKFVDTRTHPYKTIFEKTNSNKNKSVPNWFISLFPIDTPPVEQIVIKDENIIGLLVINRNKIQLYETLWNAVTIILFWMISGIILVGVLCKLVIDRIKKPINEVVSQANALTRREFIQIPESKVLELKPVTIAMNDMVSQIKSMFENEALRLDNFRKDVSLDKLTGLDTREAFMAKLHDNLIREDAETKGLLIMIRFGGLIEANKKLGRDAIDTLINKIAALALQVSNQVENGSAGRVNGIEIALLMPNQEDTIVIMDTLAKYTKAIIEVIIPENEKDSELIKLFLGCTKYNKNEDQSKILSRLDLAIAKSENCDGEKWFESESLTKFISLVTQEDWKKWFENVVAADQIRLASYAVKDSQDNLIHFESPIQLKSPDSEDYLTAGEFLPMAIRLNLIPLIDLKAVKIGISELSINKKISIAINVSNQIFTNSMLVDDLINILKANKDVLSRLSLETTQRDCQLYLDLFKQFCQEVKTLGVKVGIKQIGQNFARVANIQEFGLEYIKLNGQYSHNINKNPANKKFISEVISLFKSAGIKIMATGVTTEAEIKTLIKLKIDGLTGPAIKI